MRKSVRNFDDKAKKLLQLYSTWQETRRTGMERQCLALLGEILAIDPQFSLREEFRNAF